MCTAKAPKAAPAPKEKDPVYMRNPYLDGYSMGRAATVGRNSLRVDVSRSASAPYVPPNPAGAPAFARHPGYDAPGTWSGGGTASGAQYNGLGGMMRRAIELKQ